MYMFIIKISGNKKKNTFNFFLCKVESLYMYQPKLEKHYDENPLLFFFSPFKRAVLMEFHRSTHFLGAVHV